jgi:hypothetical protein
MRTAPILLSLLLLAGCQRATTAIPDVKARLGELHYSAPVGGVTGTESPAFRAEFLTPGTVLRQIEVGTTGNADFLVVQCLRFTYTDADGREQVYTVGRPAGAEFASPYPVPPGGQWIGISGRAGWYIDAVQFHFSDGSVSPLYGGRGGDTTFRTLITQNADGGYRGELRGIYGHAGELVEVLGLIFWPVE